MKSVTVHHAFGGGYNDWYAARSPEGQKQVVVSLKVVDPSVQHATRQQGVEVDNFERPFARVPQADGSWKDVDLSFSGTHRFGSQPKDWEDMYLTTLTGLTSADVQAIRDRGVALGLKYGLGSNEVVVWGQQEGQNFGFYHLQA